MLLQTQQPPAGSPHAAWRTLSAKQVRALACAAGGLTGQLAVSWHGVSEHGCTVPQEPRRPQLAASAQRSRAKRSRQTEAERPSSDGAPPLNPPAEDVPRLSVTGGAPPLSPPAEDEPRLSVTGKPKGWSFLSGDDSKRWQPDPPARPVADWAPPRCASLPHTETGCSFTQQVYYEGRRSFAVAERAPASRTAAARACCWAAPLALCSPRLSEASVVAVLLGRRTEGGLVLQEVSPDNGAGVGGGCEGGAGAPQAAQARAASRGQVAKACLTTAAQLGAVAWFIRARAPDLGVAALHSDPAAVAALLAGAPWRALYPRLALSRPSPKLAHFFLQEHVDCRVCELCKVLLSALRACNKAIPMRARWHARYAPHQRRARHYPPRGASRHT